MPNHVLLNNNDHKTLRVKTDHSEAYGDNVMCVPVYPVEFRHAQTHYPLVFAKDASGTLQPVALLGLEQAENLFLEGNQWAVKYKPLLMEKGPFLIGRSGQNETLSIHINLDDPRVNKSEGEVLFLPHGGNSDYIENIANILSTIHQSIEAAKAFTAALTELDLIEPFVLDVELQQGETNRLSGFSTINEEKLKQLNGEDLVSLHQQGFIELIYFMLASLSTISELVERKKKRLSINA